MAKPRNTGADASQRMLRVAELIRHTVSEILSRGGVGDPALDGQVISVPSVQISPDLKLATICVMPLGGKNVDKVMAALERNRKFLRGEIAQRINMKFAPDIRFRLDRGFEMGAQIDALLASPKVLQDLAKPTAVKEEP